MDSKYKLGIKKIDDQHQKIFDLIEVLNNNTDSVDLIDMIRDLKDYSLYHFETEEEYFDSIGFKLSYEHKILHNNFVQTINYYFDNPNNLNKSKIHAFLLSWIDHHILIDDRAYTLKENLTE